jgi:hypothetical protein
MQQAKISVQSRRSKKRWQPCVPDWPNPCQTLLKPCQTLFKPCQTQFKPCQTLFKPCQTLFKP